MLRLRRDDAARRGQGERVVERCLGLHAQGGHLNSAEPKAGVDRCLRQHPEAEQSAQALLESDPGRGRSAAARCVGPRRTLPGRSSSQTCHNPENRGTAGPAELAGPSPASDGAEWVAGDLSRRQVPDAHIVGSADVRCLVAAALAMVGERTRSG